MTYALNTLHPSSRTTGEPVRSGLARFTGELGLAAGLLALLFWLVSLLSYSTGDAAWSTSGSSGELVNAAGRLGAWLADGSYFLLGFSVWWCLAAALRVWLSSLAGWLRERELMTARPDVAPSLLTRLVSGRLAFWLGLVVLLCASTMLEWSRFYSLEARLPGHGGGILGYLLGPLGVQWLGFGSTAICRRPSA